MTPPPLPPGCSGFAVDPHIHTGCPEPDRDGWTDTTEAAAYVAGLIRERDTARAALDVAVTGLRELETTWANDADAIRATDPAIADVIAEAGAAVSALLDRIGAV